MCYNIILLFLFSVVINGQDQGWMEELYIQISEDAEHSNIESTVDPLIVERLKTININTASKVELNSIPWLTPVQIQSLLSYIEQNGPLVSKYELQAVPGWDLATIRTIEPLIKVSETSQYHDPRNSIEKLRQDGGIEIMVRAKRRLELSRGFKLAGQQAFKGSPEYLLSSIQYKKKGDLSFRITAEKDPGERLHWDTSGKHFGADFLSMHAMLENKGILKRLIVGDFRAHWDQGLVLSSGLNLGSRIITGPRKIHRGLLPHTSTLESGYFRGIGLEIEIGRTIFSPFYSHRSLDVQILPEDQITGLQRRVPSIIESGLHRTSTEIDRRQKLPEHTFGLHIRKIYDRNFKVAVSGVYRHWQWPIIPEPNRHNTFRFSGKENYNISSSMEYSWKNMNIFGQFAISASGGRAGLIGLISSLSQKVSSTIHFRSYQRNYHTILGGAFGKKSGNINERGIYWGLQITPSRHWITGVYFNMYKFPEVTSQAHGPSIGVEKMFRCQYIPNKRSQVNIFWRVQTGHVNVTPLALKFTKNLTSNTKHTIGISAKWQNKSKLAIHSRLQYTRVLQNASVTQGMLAGNQVSFGWNFLKFTLSMAIFNTDNFQNRQYIYERDLPYSLSIPFFDGLGTRWYCLTQLKIIRQVDVWLRIAQTNYRNRDQIGSGPDTIEGSKRTDISFQFRYVL